MPSQYRPQILGWIDDLDKGTNYLSGADDRLLYANDNYCAFLRKTSSDQIFYLCISTIIIVCLFPAIYIFFLLIFDFNPETESFIFITIITLFLTCIFALYISIPELYQNLFTRKGSPIIFNRKTNKVYINESYFFNFTSFKNPIHFLQPNKKRIKEYDWTDLHGVVVHNFSTYSLNTTILMVCEPGTHKTIDHVLLDPLRNGIGSYQVWGWVNNFMCFNDLIGLNDGKYTWEQETPFKKDIIQDQGWPEWMVEAFNALSPEHLTEIKQKYHVQ
ncbi:DUF6708 domain-containing protein [Gilliamella apicola]|uniref:DUF6708 domain-containing protein n=1 Tax=Gilliamella apicola TaxID=1196095 RepID=A0A242ND59_9GAMM|nr:DUF6708 domain-containing protein [Gilliamella apicola]OTP80978.1 hypothetical protein B5S40_13875 [Gilliamella apicola]OTP85604.1 hypothetical protein B5S44_04760 [Gilliamella apicola]OTP86711.1 hypothetical protein B5S42_12670 [Gilliamella apicola]OTP97616.1 hypothetical protein B6D08_14095 [Gilliamella apicola]OTQ07994.1 hypothetical protein B6C91_13705 [Gilliamella apicola]